MSKFVYLFSEMKTAMEKCGTWDDVRGLVGGKGAGLMRMSSIGLPVPFGFTLTTEVCNYVQDHGDYPAGMWEQIKTALAEVEKVNGKKFGDKAKPLLFSCRSGAKFSMPGMMDTVLNIGLNDETVESLGKLTSARFANDAYRRLIQGFGSVVMGISDEKFEEPLKEYKKSHKYHSDVDMTAEDWGALCAKFKEVFKANCQKDFPQEPFEQLKLAIGAVFNSWRSKRAIAYREKTDISHKLGTACNIQTMVFGNMGNTSATGVAFTRHPATGEKVFYGDYLINAQGEDVVAGIRNCTPVAEMGKDFKDAWQQLQDVGDKLEKEFKNMQDIEFTIEDGKLFMLQTRDGKRTAMSQVKIALDMVNEGLIGKEEAVSRVSGADINVLLLPQLDPAALKKAKDDGRCIAAGVNASPGGAVGKVVFEADLADEEKKKGNKVILVRPFTKPDDVHGFFASEGVLTAEGGATSHAAVVARQFGLPAIVGASNLEIDLQKRQFTVQGKNVVVKEFDMISLDANEGTVYVGALPTIAATFDSNEGLRTILEWADEISKQEFKRGPHGEAMKGLQVWANADSGKDATTARKYGAKGIGLCRTEHMFFDQARLPIVRDMILSKTDDKRQEALDKLLPMQRSDFEELFSAMDAHPVIIRLIDPPLHEFLPNRIELIRDLERLKANGQENKEKEALLAAINELHEENPMMGLRGIRLGILMPGLIEMQCRAILEAAVNVQKKGIKVIPEIMIPLSTHVNELKVVKPRVEAIAADVFKAAGITIDYKYGTMVETPRAALTAGQLAEVCEFFSFGTNDLTQMTFGISRDDGAKFLLHYKEHEIYPANPFQAMDPDGVGRLVKLACKEGRETRADLSVGICGEHGGEESSIEICFNAGLDYVSCSPFRVPVARLAAAHAALHFMKK